MNEKKNSTLKETFSLAVQNHKKNNFEIAEKLYKEILSINPDHFESIFLLGTLSAQIKKLDSAKKLLQKAIKLKSNYVEAHYNLGNVLIALGDTKEAMNCFEKTIQINPNHADAYNNLGNLLKVSGEDKKAKDHYEKAIQINPNNANAHNNLGTIFQKLKKFQTAISSYEKAIKINSNHASAHNNLGLIFHELEDYKKAIISYKKAIQINPKYWEAYSSLGNVHKQLGEFDKAINCYENAIKYNPKNLIYFFQLSELKKNVLDLDLKNHINKIIKNEESTKINLAYGNFLLAGYELQSQNYEKEFNHLLKGHFYYFESRKEKFKNEIDYWLNVLPNVNKLINLNQSDINIKKNDDEIKPIFIVGVPRCGSTLVEKIIASGSQIIPIGEETSILKIVIEDLINQKKPLITDINIIRTIVFEEYKKKDLIHEKSKYIFTDKSLDNFFYIGLIKKIFPKAKVVNCKRNALSSIVSIIKNNLVDVAWAHSLENIFEYFNIYHQMIEYYKKKFPNFIYELNYDEFVNNPEMGAKKLFNFCDLPWDKKCLEFYKRQDIISKTASNIQIRKPVYKDSIKKYLPYKYLLSKYESKFSWLNSNI